MGLRHPTEQHRYCKECKKVTKRERRGNDWVCTKCRKKTPHCG